MSKYQQESPATAHSFLFADIDIQIRVEMWDGNPFVSNAQKKGLNILIATISDIYKQGSFNTYFGRVVVIRETSLCYFVTNGERNRRDRS